jgi:osmotically-inducible protein OsmY
MSSDSDLKTAVLAELKWEPSVNAAHIGVTTHAGIVTLTGHAENYMQKLRAEKAASRVRGVNAIAAEIEVKLPFNIKRSDEDIAEASVDRLGWNTATRADAIKVKVQKGWVTLTGTVGWHFEKQAAEKDVRALSGVIGVSNQIVVKPSIDASNVKRILFLRPGHDPGGRAGRQDHAVGQGLDLECATTGGLHRMVRTRRDVRGERHHRQLLSERPSARIGSAGVNESANRRIILLLRLQT